MQRRECRERKDQDRRFISTWPDRAIRDCNWPYKLENLNIAIAIDGTTVMTADSVKGPETLHDRRPDENLFAVIGNG
jgi:hypothetical protein